jgi:hypothetical protein
MFLDTLLLHVGLDFGALTKKRSPPKIKTPIRIKTKSWTLTVRYLCYLFALLELTLLVSPEEKTAQKIKIKFDLPEDYAVERKTTLVLLRRNEDAKRCVVNGILETKLLTTAGTVAKPSFLLSKA